MLRMGWNDPCIHNCGSTALNPESFQFILQFLILESDKHGTMKRHVRIFLNLNEPRMIRMFFWPLQYHKLRMIKRLPFDIHHQTISICQTEFVIIPSPSSILLLITCRKSTYY
jgi:hypothetical protein